MAGTRALGWRKVALIAIVALAFAAAAPELTGTPSHDSSKPAASSAVPGFRSSDAPAVAYRATASGALRVVHRVRFGETPAISLVAALSLLLAAMYWRRRRSLVARSHARSFLPIHRRGPPRLQTSG